MVIHGEENLGEYTFNLKKNHHRFCKICAVPIDNVARDKEVDFHSVNVRALNDVDLKALELDKSNGWDEEEGAQYEI